MGRVSNGELQVGLGGESVGLFCLDVWLFWGLTRLFPAYLRAANGGQQVGPDGTAGTA